MNQDRKRSRIGEWSINLGLAFLSILLILVIAEALLRTTSYRLLIEPPKITSPVEYFRPDFAKGYDISENVPPGNYRLCDLDYTAQYEIWSNELGCFDRPYAGEMNYILLVGDSFTHFGTPFQDKWGSFMEDLLGERTLKCGVAGYGTRQELLKSKDVMGRVKSPAQLIVVGYFLNDLLDDYEFHCKMQTPQREEDARPEGGPRSPAGQAPRSKSLEEPLRRVKLWLQEHSILYVITREVLKSNIARYPFIADLLTKAGVLYPYGSLESIDSQHPVIQQAWKIHFQNIADFKAMAQKSNAGLLFVLIPRKEQVYPWLRDWRGSDPEGYNKKLGHFLETNKIDYIDLLPLFRRYSNPQPKKYLDRENDLYWRYDCHLNVKGNHLTGLLVARFIVEKDLITIRHREKVLERIDREFAHFQSRQPTAPLAAGVQCQAGRRD